jgi:hypothetical protein
MIPPLTVIDYPGYNFPTLSQLSAGLLPAIVPMILGLLFPAVYAGLTKAEGGGGGDFVVTLALAGITIGCLWNMLTNGFVGSTSGLIPLAETVAMATLTGIWVYQGATGSGDGAIVSS